MSIELSALQLDPRNTLRRSPPRPQHLRELGYEDAFDFLTVFYDCFSSPGRQWMILVGPPLANLEADVVPILREALGPHMPPDFIVRNMDRHSQIWIRTARGELYLPPGIFSKERIEAEPSHCDLFEGKRVVFTKSKDNDLRWIRDWADFYARKHGCNAVLLYDNASTSYTSSEIRKLLTSVVGIEVVVVVDWPYKFGPQGGENNIWDSDFGQYGILEHARHRFLGLADAVVNADIDELVITKNSASVFDVVQQSRTGYLSYGGIWIENVCASDLNDERRHVNFAYTSKLSSELKWSLAPQRCRMQFQWRIHDILAMPVDRELSETVSYRHFRAISTNWRHRRWNPERPTHAHMIDEELVEWMRVFQ